jgi:hypothetical protein
MSRGVEHRDSLPLDREEHISGDGGRDRRAVGLFTTEGEISGVSTALGIALLSQGIDEATLTLALDYDSGGNLSYIGKSAKGSSKSDAVWQIKKVTFDSNDNLTDIQWADSDDNFDNEWTNRASLSYG